MSLLALDTLRERIVERLGLHRLVDRPAPFEPASAPVGTTPGAAGPDVTVVVPAFQHEQYIVDALRSVLAQTYSGYRVLVADDASTDRTVERARALNDPRVTVTVNPANLGLGRSLIAALEQVTTPFVAILNSDDLFHPERLQRAREALLADRGLQVVATGVELADKHGRVLHADTVSRILDGLRIFHWVRWYERVTTTANLDEAPFVRLLRNNFLLTSSNIVCQTDFLRAHSAAVVNLKYCLDWHVFLTAAAESRLRILPGRLLAYRLHASNTVWFTAAGQSEYRREVAAVARGAIRHAVELPGGAWCTTTGNRAAIVANAIADNEAVDPATVLTPALLRALE